ncbi:unnamed protein product, partial [Brachionus calyciflorus]
KSVNCDSKFVIDLNEFNLDAVLKDDYGPYRPYGNKKLLFDIKIRDKKYSFKNLTKVPKKSWPEDSHVYEIERIYFKCKANILFTRKSLRVADLKDLKSFQKLFLGYVWEEKINEWDKSIKIKPHGNCTKSVNEFIPLEKKTLIGIKNESVKAGSSSIKYFDMISNKTSDSLSQIPRSINQLYMHKYLELKAKKKNVKTHDEYSDALINRKKSDFVRHIDFGYNRLECVLFTEQQYNDLIRFCTSYRNFSIVNIDTTFNLGQYYVTYLTYRNISLKIQATETHPVFIGPILIHLHRDKEAYLSFAMQLQKFDILNKNRLNDITCFITDDDAAIRSAFKTVFKNSEFMLCCNHLRKDFLKIMNQFKVPEESKNEIIFKMFGSQNNRTESLIGSKDKQDFEEKSNS